MIVVSLCMITDLRWAFNFSQQNSYDLFSVGSFLPLQDKCSVPSCLFPNFLPSSTLSPSWRPQLSLTEYTQALRWRCSPFHCQPNLNSCFRLSPVSSWLTSVGSGESIAPLIQGAVLLRALQTPWFSPSEGPHLFTLSRLHHTLLFTNSLLSA